MNELDPVRCVVHRQRQENNRGDVEVPSRLAGSRQVVEIWLEVDLELTMRRGGELNATHARQIDLLGRGDE